MNVIRGPFEWDEIRLGDHGKPVLNDGDYFKTVQQAMDITGHGEDHVWSVAFEDDWVFYGPAHHYVNVIGYTVTEEPHDNNTYIEELIEYGT